MWCTAVETHYKLLNRVVSGASFLIGGVFECDLARRRSAAVLCMLYKIRCNPMHPLHGALPVPYVPVLVTLGAVIARSIHLCSSLLQNLAEPPDFYSLISISVNDLCDPVLDGVGSGGFKTTTNASLFTYLVAPFLSPNLFLFSSFFLWVGIVGLGSSD